MDSGKGFRARAFLWAAAVLAALPAAGDVDRLEAERIADGLRRLYAPEARERGRVLDVVIDWGQIHGPYGQVGERGKSGERWLVRMSGAFTRHSHVNADVFAGVVCHEIGHALGGWPKHVEDDGSVRWSSIEAQADYFSTAQCLKRWFVGDDNEAAVEGRGEVPREARERCAAAFPSSPEDVAACIRSAKEPPREARERCAAAFPSPKDAAVCVRSAVTALEAMQVLSMVSGWVGGKARLDTPSPLVVRETDLVRGTEDPSVQCRLDTLFQGALCDKPANKDFSDSDHRPGACTREEGYVDGVRPACWFAAP